MADKRYMRVTLVRRAHGRKPAHRACVRGLGLRWLNHAVVVEDTPSTRGMANKVAYMVKVEEL
jgi:large subunit ribosomal protein L30